MLAFIGTAGAGLSTLIVTFMVGWQLAVLRAVSALAFALALSFIIARFLEPKLAGSQAGYAAEPISNRDFCELAPEDIGWGNTEPSFPAIWRKVLKISRIILPWMLLSLFMAALVQALVPDKLVGSILGGSFMVFKSALVGVPFYFAGGADLPLLYVLLNKGMPYEAAIAFMLAVPVINLPVLSMMGGWLGYRVALIFLSACVSAALIVGLFFGYVGMR